MWVSGGLLVIKGIGNIKLKAKDRGIIKLVNILFILELGVNLLSIS